MPEIADIYIQSSDTFADLGFWFWFIALVCFLCLTGLLVVVFRLIRKKILAKKEQQQLLRLVNAAKGKNSYYHWQQIVKTILAKKMARADLGKLHGKQLRDAIVAHIKPGYSIRLLNALCLDTYSKEQQKLDDEEMAQFIQHCMKHVRHN